MAETRCEPFSDQWVEPLLGLGNTDPAPEVRLAALKAAAHFPLGRMAWRDLASGVSQRYETSPARLHSSTLFAKLAPNAVMPTW